MKGAPPWRFGRDEKMMLEKGVEFVPTIRVPGFYVFYSASYRLTDRRIRAETRPNSLFHSQRVP
jgi:hypothetical protein